MQRSRFYLTMAASLLLIACSNPVEDQPQKPSGDDTRPTSKTCGKSGAICVGGTVCCGDSCVNTDININHCGSCNNACDEAKGETCSAAKCSAEEEKPDDSVCKESEVQCVEQEYQICNNNSWKTTATCTADQDCTKEHGCVERANKCEEGSYKCGEEDGNLYICTNGKYNMEMECGEGSTCSVEKKTCEIDVVVICEANKVVCENNKVSKCKEDGSAWVEQKTCAPTEMCGTDDCVTINCTDGQKICRNDDVYKCADNDFQLDIDCKDDEFCSVDKCVKFVCKEGAMQCAGNKIQTCKNNAWTDSQTCKASQFCNDTGDKPVCQAKCGNGVLDEGETCDSSATDNPLNGATCASATKKDNALGTLACNGSCSGFVTTNCYWCGNNKIDQGEICDGTAGSAPTCATAMSNEFSKGTVVCQDSCKGWDKSGCSNPECGGNEYKCDGNVLKKCVNGFFTTDTTCNTGNNICDAEHKTCIAKQGTCDPTKDDFICDGNLLLGCDNGVWKLEEECKGSKPYCDINSLECLAKAPTCSKIGETSCQGDTVMKCGYDYQLTVETKCGVGMQAANKYCVENAVADGAACVYSNETCKDNEQKCGGNSILSCFEGHWWASPCGYQTPYCKEATSSNPNAMCVKGNQCKEGQVSCDDNWVMYCNDQQLWESSWDCAEISATAECDVSVGYDNLYCAEKGASAACTNGEKRCNGSAYMVCNNGEWSITNCASDNNYNTTCDTNKGCIAGCEDGVGKCSTDGRYLECDNESWVELDNCATNTNGNNTCDATKGCVNTRTCPAAIRCENNHYIMCENGIDTDVGTCDDYDKQTECVADETMCKVPETNATWCNFQSLDINNTHNAYLRINPNKKPASAYEARLVCGDVNQSVMYWSVISNATVNASCSNCGNVNVEYMAPIPSTVTGDMRCIMEVRDVGTYNWFYCTPRGENNSNPPKVIYKWTYLKDNMDTRGINDPGN